MMYVVRKILSGLENIASTPDAEALVRISEAQMKALKSVKELTALLLLGTLVVCGLLQAEMINLTEQQEGG